MHGDNAKGPLWTRACAAKGLATLSSLILPPAYKGSAVTTPLNKCGNQGTVGLSGSFQALQRAVSERINIQAGPVWL